MKKGPDLVVVLIMVFLVGTLATGLSYADFELVSLVSSATR